jgi:hypothetical protein
MANTTQVNSSSNVRSSSGSFWESPEFWMWAYDKYESNKDKKPKAYSTPEEKELFRRKIADLDYSPSRDFIGEGVMAGMKQMESFDPSRLQFKSDYMRDSAPLGGLQGIKFDWSRMPQFWRKPGTGAPDGYGGQMGGARAEGPHRGGLGWRWAALWRHDL